MSNEADKTIEWKDSSPGSGEPLWKGPIFNINQVMRHSPQGEEHPFVVCHAPDWVTVIAKVEGEFLMVRQFRHGSASISCEFPAGVVDPGEEAIDAAYRELLEETGYRAGTMTQIGVINPNPAFMDNLSYTYLAEDLSLVGDLDLDETEFVEPVRRSFEAIDEGMGNSEYNSAIMVQAWYWYQKHLIQNS